MGDVRVEAYQTNANQPEWQDANGLPQDRPRQRFALSNLSLIAGRKKLRQDVPYGGIQLLRIDNNDNLCVVGDADHKIVSLLEEIRDQLKINNEALLRLR